MSSARGGEILCVTPNPALDRTLEVPSLRPGTMMRATSARAAAGGKGVNVARALAALGAEPRCLGPIGGATGRIVADLAEAEGLRSAWTWCEGETRTCVILVDSAAREATVINEAGPPLLAGDWKRFGADVLARVPGAQGVCVSGSLPPGTSPEALADLCRALGELGQPPWVDTSGAPLAAALSVRGVQLKINREEAEEVLGRRLTGIAACRAAAQQLLGHGMATVVLTLGAEGAILAAGDECWHASLPPVETSSAVASGDSFLAGLVAARASGRDFPEAMRCGVAAGAANAVAGGGARFPREQYESLLARTAIAPI